MPLIRCKSCAYANAADAKLCKRCGTALSVPPPHLMRCAHCGSLNPLDGTICVWCYRKLPSGRIAAVQGLAKPKQLKENNKPGGAPRQRGWRRWPARGSAAAAVALLAALGYYAYPRGLPQDVPVPVIVAPAPAPVAPPAEPPLPATEAPRTDRQPGETPRAKAAPAAIARQASARKAGEPAEAAADCAEGVAALGLCGKTQAREPRRPQACTEAAAALGLCDARNLQGRE
jgi:hypothetical protein